MTEAREVWRGRRRGVGTAALAALAVALAVAAPAGANGFPHFAISLRELLDLLRSPDPQHRLGAATSLGIRREAAAVDALLGVVERPDELEGVRVEAAEALGAIRDGRALARLAAHVARDPSPRVRGQIAEVLGDLGGDLAVATLRGLGVGDPSGDVRGRAALALARLGAPGTRELLEGRLVQEPAASARAAVLQALGELGDERAAARVLGVFIDEGEPSVRVAAALALGRLGDRRATPSLLAALDDTGSDPEVRQAAALALARLRDPAAIPVLERLLGADEVVMVVLAVRALGETERPEGVAPLVRFGQDARREIERLAGTSSPDAFRRHVELLTSEIEVVRALARLRDGRAWPLLEWALGLRAGPVASVEGLRLRERRYELRRAAILALATVPEAPRALRRLSRALTDGDPRMRAEAARALGLRGSPGGAALLQRALRDSDAEVRWEAARALGALKGNTAVPQLLRALADPHPRVVAEAARALGELSAGEAISRLETLARSRPEDEVRAAAAEALLRLRR